MTNSAGRTLAVFAAGMALSVAPLAFATIATPAPSRAECDAQQTGAEGAGCTPPADCPSDKVVLQTTGECVDQMTAITRQLEALPAPPQLSGFSATTGEGGVPVLNVPPPQLNIPAPELYLPDVVLPGIGFGVSVLPINLPPPQLPNLSQLPPPQLPDLTKLPPPQLPDLTKPPW